MSLPKSIQDLVDSQEELTKLYEQRYLREKRNKEIACNLLEDLVDSISMFSTTNVSKYRKILRELRK